MLKLKIRRFVKHESDSGSTVIEQRGSDTHFLPWNSGQGQDEVWSPTMGNGAKQLRCETSPERKIKINTSFFHFPEMC